LLIEKVKHRQIPYVHPIHEFLEARKYEQIYNRKFDAGHWNEHGAFIGHSMIISKLQEYFPEVKILSKRDFNIYTTKAKTLLVSHFDIDDEVPNYEPKKAETEVNHTYNPVLQIDEYQFQLIQAKAFTGKPRIMMFRDSYFWGVERYYGQNFDEIISIHSTDHTKNIEYFINIFEPDVVLIENAERVISPNENLFSLENMKNTILHDYSDLSLPIAGNNLSISISPNDSSIIVSSDDIITTITGTAAYVSDGKPGKALFAKVSGKYYSSKYPSAEPGKETVFSLSLNSKTLRKADNIEFIMISRDGTFRCHSVAFSIRSNNQ
jgi:hypothetical protein